MIDLDKNFAETIKSGKWVVDAWKSGCGYCDQYAPTFEAVASEITDVNFAKVKADDIREFRNLYLTGEEITMPNGMKQRKNLGSPTTFIFVDGVKQSLAEGNLPKEVLVNYIKTGIPPTKPAPAPAFSKNELVAIHDLLGTAMIQIKDMQMVGMLIQKIEAMIGR